MFSFKTVVSLLLNKKSSTSRMAFNCTVKTLISVKLIFLETLPSYGTCDLFLMQKSYAFMTSRLDYCNALLAACPASSINKLQIDSG